MVSLHPIIAEDIAAIAATPLPWERFAGKAVLITGAAGFLPAYLVETLLHLNDTRALNCRVLGLVRNLAKARTRFAHHAARSDLRLIEGDVACPLTWPEPAHFIIHAASQASPKHYGPDPVGTFNANVLGTHHLLEQARTWQSEGFLFVSSGEVYGRVAAEHIPTKESDYGWIEITESRSCYAEGKRAAETLGVSHAKQFGTPFVIGRPFHTYGPGMSLDDGRVHSDFLLGVLSHRDLVLHSDGQAVRAFCYLADAVAGLFTVLLKGSTGTAYNVGNPAGALSIRALADLLAGLGAGGPLKVSHEGQPASGYLPSPIPVNVPDVTRLRALGWQPVWSPKDGFARTLASFRLS
ncbi:MAG TPA: NAD-dependent epimerase/dehydratase family protein [Opitutaceae bacterium]|nr:NAD-dependent epimerase/dehydratase family protein [Opitutaceae bacterium]HRJ46665.1 NAD-dependent epimerase/dehydratase family protein [Opitutaceae bacterium]